MFLAKWPNQYNIFHFTVQRNGRWTPCTSMLMFAFLHENHIDQLDDPMAETIHHNLRLFWCLGRKVLWHCRTWGNFLIIKQIRVGHRLFTGGSINENFSLLSTNKGAKPLIKKCIISSKNFILEWNWCRITRFYSEQSQQDYWINKYKYYHSMHHWIYQRNHQLCAQVSLNWS